jgi:hypothetical protein
MADPQDVREQYRTTQNLDARIRLHQRFSMNAYGWLPWVFDQLELTRRVGARGRLRDRAALDREPRPRAAWLAHRADRPLAGDGATDTSRVRSIH